jgi:hypothetical protein
LKIVIEGPREKPSGFRLIGSATRIASDIRIDLDELLPIADDRFSRPDSPDGDDR